jgi:hypothetical protein
MPETSPLLATVATEGLLLTHVPPKLGDTLVVYPTHMLFGPFMSTVGLGLIVIGRVDSEVHPVEVKV